MNKPDEKKLIPPSVPGLRKYALGNDLVFVPGFAQTFNDTFREKVYTAQELAYCLLFEDSVLRFASTWAAKEAVYKALKQLKHRPPAIHRIEIKRNKPGGMPEVILHGRSPFNGEISLSITHDGDYVWAIALAERR